jgi:hypothetical protein
VDVRITVKAESELAAVQLIQPLEDTLRHRLGDCVYGVDQASLEDAALQPLAAHSLTLVVIEAGLGGELIRRLAAVRGPFLGGMVVTDLPTLGELLKLTDSYRLSHNANLGLGVSIHPNDDAQELHQVLITPNETKNFTRRYGGPSEYASTWAINQSLDLIRRLTHDS